MAAASSDMRQPHEPDSFVEACLAEGFAQAGVTPCEPPPRAGMLQAWLDGDMHGSMEWMTRHAVLRVDPSGLLAGARSIICVADRYEPPCPSGGQIAAYAKGRDYHRVMKRRLHRLCDAWKARWPDASFRACVDTAPIMERAHAEAAGLGRVGKNTLLIEQGIGSWFLLGEVLTTLDIRATPATDEDPCGTCTRCIDACPTDALTPWHLDARRCIAALTIEHRGVIPTDLHAGIGAWMFGCDICQQVCPHNHPTGRSEAAVVGESYTPRLHLLEILEVLRWTEEDRVRRLQGTPMTRATLDMWRRNACIAAAERGDDARIRSVIDEIASSSDEPEIVRAAAQSTLAGFSRA
jgi:epoxyqueuosine reductase